MVKVVRCMLLVSSIAGGASRLYRTRTLSRLYITVGHYRAVFGGKHNDHEPKSASVQAIIVTMAATAAVRVATPEIRWHCGPTGLNEAVLSLDFLPAAADDSGAVVLATGGADKEIKLWRVRDALGDGAAADDKSGKDDKDDGEDAAEKEGGRGKSDAVRGLEFVFSLSGHDRSVNCVRFSPNGEFLASASDDTSVILWTRPKTAGPDWRWDTVAALSDVARTILSLGHKGDITDLAWSPDSQFLCSTSIDNRSVIWHVGKGDVVERRKDHTQYVQGAAWDPLNEFVVTEGNDRTCRVYALGGFTRQTAGRKSGRKMTCVQTIKTREFPSSVDEEKQAEQNKPAASAAPQQSDSRPAPPKHRMFLDDTCPAFARRPAWTPDGSYLLTPTGTFRATESAKAVNTVYAFARGDLSAPTLHLPGHDKASLAVRCSPLVYELRDGDKTGNFFQTNYRSIFAVVTLNAIVLYDTQVGRFLRYCIWLRVWTYSFVAFQQAHPICTVKDMHYADLTDASWSADGQTLSVSSMDGYLSFIRFAPGFFGTSLPPQSAFVSGHWQTRQRGLSHSLTHPMLMLQNSRRRTRQR